MSNRFRVLTTTAIVLQAALFSATVAAVFLENQRLESMPEKYREWLEQDVLYIITGREREAFLDLRSVEEWEAFINSFWRRRDPDPLTPENEFKDEHYRRLGIVEREFGRESAVPGWMTDRGKIYTILGKPDDRTSFPAEAGLYPVEVWFYQADRDKSLPPLYLLFFQQGAAGPFRLFNHLLDKPEDLMPASAIDPSNARLSAYEMLQNVSPELAHAAMTLRADESPFANIQNPERAGLDFQAILNMVEDSPFRRVDTSYVDAARSARGLVESEYLFNYVPNSSTIDVLPGPGDTSFVHYSVELEPRHMTLANDDNVYYTKFQLRGEVTTPDGKESIVQFVKEPYMRLTESQFREISRRPFSYRDMFPMAGGDFVFRVVLKNQARSEYTIVETDLHVPEVSRAPYLGRPVLLYDFAELTQPEMNGAYRTYQVGAFRLNPNAKKAYSIGEILRAYIPVVHAGDDDRLSLRIFDQGNTVEHLVEQDDTDRAVRRGSHCGKSHLERIGGRSLSARGRAARRLGQDSCDDRFGLRYYAPHPYPATVDPAGEHERRRDRPRPGGAGGAVPEAGRSG